MPDLRHPHGATGLFLGATGQFLVESLLLLVTASSDQNRVSRYEQMHK